MEYNKYLKYKTKYLQLKYKIKSEAKSSQNIEENTEDSKIIIHTRSPLQQMRLKTSENEQTGGLTFKTGYYAYFCNYYDLPYKYNGTISSDDIINILGFQGYSLKLFTARTFGKLGKAQGEKMNLVFPTGPVEKGKSISWEDIRKQLALTEETTKEVIDVLNESTAKTIFKNLFKMIAYPIGGTFIAAGLALEESIRFVLSFGTSTFLLDQYYEDKDKRLSSLAWGSMVIPYSITFPTKTTDIKHLPKLSDLNYNYTTHIFEGKDSNGKPISDINTLINNFLEKTIKHVNDNKNLKLYQRPDIKTSLGVYVDNYNEKKINCCIIVDMNAVLNSKFIRRIVILDNGTPKID
jgi:hypothetical protein